MTQLAGNPREVERAFGLKPHHIDRLIRSGAVQSYASGGRSIVLCADVERALRARFGLLGGWYKAPAADDPSLSSTASLTRNGRLHAPFQVDIRVVGNVEYDFMNCAAGKAEGWLV